MTYVKPEVTLLGNAGEVIQARKHLSAESTVLAEQIVPDAEFD
jgi:hypothetical protein